MSGTLSYSDRKTQMQLSLAQIGGSSEMYCNIYFCLFADMLSNVTYDFDVTGVCVSIA